MKALLFILYIITSSVGAPVSEEAQAEILQFDNTNDGKGNYAFSFMTSNGLERNEIGTLVNEGQPDEHIEIQGSYSYIDPDGKIITINYTADVNGYKILTFVPSTVYSAPPALVASLLGG